MEMHINVENEVALFMLTLPYNPTSRIVKMDLI